MSQLCIVANIDKNDTIDPEVGLYRTIMAHAVAEVIKKKGNKGGFSDISCLVVAIQRISDFDKSKSEVAAAVLGVAEWIVLFSVEGKESDILKNQLNMSDAEIEIARQLCGLKGSYSEFMLRNKNGTWQICRLMLDKFSAKLYLTSADDVVAIRKLKAQGLSIVQAINHLIASECHCQQEREHKIARKRDHFL